MGKTKRGKGTKLMALADHSGVLLSLRMGGKRFCARGHARREEVLATSLVRPRTAQALDRRPGLGLRSARRGPQREGHRDDRPAPQEQEQAQEDPGRAQAQALQEAPLEDREAIRLAGELPAAGGPLRATSGELPRLRASWVHGYPAAVFVR